ncbi:unnamed protein product [Protopolystoma xenopodis]|uniref:Uncharacterized protein n=1 Tax=Protopolystoma xenopodis TaxID=117903 RepID=A0A448WYC4_9PLAT|nr:unnamed protein product [Protopolystoma xenopodis]
MLPDNGVYQVRSHIPLADLTVLHFETPVHLSEAERKVVDFWLKSTHRDTIWASVDLMGLNVSTTCFHTTSKR